MLHMDHFSLIPIDDGETDNTETWLYVLEKKLNRVAFMPSENPAFALNSKCINPKEEHWLENTSPGDILLQEAFNTPDTLSENDQTKIIDTRTFTRPRKARMPIPSPSHHRPEPPNLNSTFNFVPTSNGSDALNATVVIEDANSKTMQLNSTFQVELNGLGEEEEPVEQLSPSNNNVYALNNTFDMNPTRSVVVTNRRLSQVKTVLNSTYGESDPMPTKEPPPVSFNEMDELDEDDRVDEIQFRKPLLPGAVPKKTTLVRTSTLNNEGPVTPEMESPPMLPQYGMKDIEKIAKLQEESLAQTSTPMGRRLSAFRRTVDVDQNLGSPISTLPAHEGTINYGPPIPLRDEGMLCSSNNSNSPLDNSNHAIRGQLTFEKSPMELDSNSPTSPADSPYSSQSLESDNGASAQDLLRRSMPNLNNQSRLRLPQPSASNLNRQHGSDSGLRPPSAAALAPPGSQLIRPSIGSTVNGSLIRPQFKLPPPVSELRKPNPVPSGGLSMAPPRAMASKLMAPRASSAPQRNVTAVAPTVDDLNGTVVIEKPVVVVAAAAPVPALSGIPRPSFSKIPTPRTTATKSSIPTMAARPRPT